MRKKQIQTIFYPRRRKTAEMMYHHLVLHQNMRWERRPSTCALHRHVSPDLLWLLRAVQSPEGQERPRRETVHLQRAVVGGRSTSTAKTTDGTGLPPEGLRLEKEIVGEEQSDLRRTAVGRKVVATPEDD